MVARNFDLSQEPLWSTPQPAQERTMLGLDRSDYRSFVLSGIYCGMNLFLLLLFGYSAIKSGDRFHAAVLLTLAGTSLTGYAAIWISGWYALAKHFTTGVMLILCLYLFHSGGVQNTGPLYYFVFPSAALFLHGRLHGFIWVILLLLLTILISQGMFDFAVGRYSNIFISRLTGICLLITILCCIPEYFRTQAERNLLLTCSDLESMTYSDLRTGLASRSLLEKILQLEFNRNLRYSSACSLMFIETDPVSSVFSGVKTDINSMQVMGHILRTNLRAQDLAGLWDNSSFLLILPETNLEEARTLAQRLLAEVSAHGATSEKNQGKITASIGIADLDKSSPAKVLNRAADNLLAAQGKNGNCCVAL